MKPLKMEFFLIECSASLFKIEDIEKKDIEKKDIEKKRIIYNTF
jgi:hypothetical protein